MKLLFWVYSPPVARCFYRTMPHASQNTFQSYIPLTKERRNFEKKPFFLTINVLFHQVKEIRLHATKCAFHLMVLYIK